MVQCLIYSVIRNHHDFHHCSGHAVNVAYPRPPSVVTVPTLAPEESPEQMPLVTADETEECCL